eukprot:scaffold6299_cov107-Cylindrotheca_fusiformis.AAC.8
MGNSSSCWHPQILQSSSPQTLKLDLFLASRIQETDQERFFAVAAVESWSLALFRSRFLVSRTGGEWANSFSCCSSSFATENSSDEITDPVISILIEGGFILASPYPMAMAGCISIFTVIYSQSIFAAIFMEDRTTNGSSAKAWNAASFLAT